MNTEFVARMNGMKKEEAKARESTAKGLRIGVIHNGRILEERLFRKIRPVSIGRSGRNTLSLPLPHLPYKFRLFRPSKGQYHLGFNGQMDGRISFQGQVMDFNGLKDHPLVAWRGETAFLPLNAQSRGKIIFGQTTVLFQFIPLPPAPHRPRLPANLRGGWFKNIDWVFTTIAMISLLAHSAGLVYAANLPLNHTRYEMPPDRFVKYLVARPQADPPPLLDERRELEAALSEKNAAQVQEKISGTTQGNPVKSGPPGDPVKKARNLAAARLKDRDKLRSKVNNTGMLKVLTALGKSGKEGGNLADLLRYGSIDRGLDGAFKKAPKKSAMALNIHDRPLTLRLPEGGGTAQTIKKRIVLVADKIKRKGKKLREVEVELKGPMEVEEGLSPEAVSEVVRRRKNGIQICYQRALKRQFELQGKVVVRFTISKDTGRVIKRVLITSDTVGSAQLADCISETIGRWRFPRPEGINVTVSYPFTFIRRG